MKIENNNKKSKLRLIKVSPELHEKLRVIAFKKRTTMKELIETAAISHYNLPLKRSAATIN